MLYILPVLLYNIQKCYIVPPVMPDQVLEILDSDAAGASTWNFGSAI